MGKRYQAIYKCRGCGRLVSEDEAIMAKDGEISAKLIFEDGMKVERANLHTGGIGDGFYVLHRCFPFRLYVCDFIGWEKVFDCPECGKTISLAGAFPFDICPNCGKKMEEA